MDPPAAEAVAALPPQRRRRGARSVEWTLIIAISFSILSLLKLEPLARNSVQGHNNKKSSIDLPQTNQLDASITNTTTTNITSRSKTIFPKGSANTYNPFWLVTSKTRKIAITIIPKVMCSTIRNTMSITIENCTTKTNPGGVRCAEARRSGQKNFTYMEEQNYTTILILRDPFERALSAYHNSGTNPHIYTQHCKSFKDCTFDRWVDDIVDQLKPKVPPKRTNEFGGNEHFLPQTRIAQLDEMNYHYLLRMSSRQDLDFFFGLLGLDSIPEKKNKSKNSNKRTDMPNNRTMSKLASVYKEDLILWQSLLHRRQEGEELTLYDYWN